MKKLILTEIQLSGLVSYLLEADSEEDIPTKEEQEKNRKILEEIRTEFNGSLKKMNSCDDLIILFSEIYKEDEKFVQDSKSLVVLRAMGTTKKGIRFKAVRLSGKETGIIKDNVYDMMYNNSFNITDEGANLKLYLADIKKDKNGKTPPSKLITVDNFQIYKVVKNNGDCKKQTVEPDTTIIELGDVWKKSVDKLLQQVEYQASLFGMNNFFFFPKGFAAMDDILKKYGLSVNKRRRSESDFVLFKVLSKPKTQSSLKKGGEVEGTIDHKNNIEVGKLYIEVPDGQKIIKGEKFNVKVYSVTKSTKAFMHDSTIEILIQKQVDIIDDTPPTSEPTSEPTNTPTNTPTSEPTSITDKDGGNTENTKL